MKNIIIIILDGVRAKNLSLYGYEKENDRNLKMLAKEGVLFKNYFSVSNSTAPSLTALLTGKYPNNNGIIHQFPYTEEKEIEKLRKEKFWFPSYLKSKGYNTFAIDWIKMWFKRGFDYYGEKEEEQKKVRKFMNNPFIKKILLNLPSWAYTFGKKVVKFRSSPEFPPPDKTMDLAISKIESSEKPFFLFVHFLDTHFPFKTIKDPPLSGKNDLKEVVKKISLPQREYVKKRITDIGLKSSEDIINKYDLAIETLDGELGKLIDYLKKKKLWNNTIIAVLADHGENFGEHGIYYSHAGLYNESTHVPLVMRIPGYSGKVDAIVQNVDVVPTLIDSLGDKKMLNKFDGKSLLPLIGKGGEIRKFAYSWDGLAGDVKSKRTLKMKTIISKDSVCKLCKAEHHKKIEKYNLEKDPNEKNNLAQK